MTEFRSQFRLPSELAHKLKRAAEANHRSLNAEIVERLVSTFDGNDRASQEQIDRIEGMLEKLVSSQDAARQS